MGMVVALRAWSALPLPSNSKGSPYTYNREVRRLRAVGRLPDILLFFRFKFLLRMARTISSAHSDRRQHKASNDVRSKHSLRKSAADNCTHAHTTQTHSV